jgi:hypothetical protein
VNIFILDQNPKIAAGYHNDKHCVKMILESAQMLSTAVRLTGVDAGYKMTHKNHPCTVWCRASLANWMWLKSLASGLNEQFKLRFGHVRNHKSFDLICSLPVPEIEDIGITPFAQAMPEKYRDVNPVTAYRNFYMEEKRHLAQWKNQIPEWWN